MKTRTWGLWVGALLLGGLLLSAGLASAQTAAVGLVDTGRVAQEYKAMQALNEQFNTFQREREQKLMERQRVMLLPEADATKYFDLKQVAAPTDATKKQLEDLESLAKQREERFRALGEKQGRTADEQKEFDDLNQLYAARVNDLRALQEDMSKEVQAKREELTKLITTSLETAIKSVAAEKKVTLVIAKEAVLYGGLDITEEVLAKLNALPAAPAK